MAFRKFKLDWKLKTAVFWLLDTMPGGDRCYYLLQRHVTKTVPRNFVPTAETAEAQIGNALAFKQHWGSDLSKATLLEFGAGWDLYSNFIMYCMGVDRQYVIDLNRWAKAETINTAITHLQNDPPPGSVRVPKDLVADATLEADLKKFYGIEYQAPADARNVALPDGAIDLIATTSVLEHIPAESLAQILTECHRLLNGKGYMRHVIDYSDHYAHSDDAITEFNYLRFSPEQWKRYNPGIHYQNRMRSRQFLELFRNAGFEVIVEDVWRGEKATLDRVPVDASFAHLSTDEQLELGGRFLMKKAAA